jgi:cell fate (sporulation/competence/biofilm development) regulator YlbF (YheA/YmcA/DUF963 family)
MEQNEFVETSPYEVKDSLFYRYIEEHPEDHEKISEFINKEDIHSSLIKLLEDYIPPETKPEDFDGCLMCNKTWAETPTAVKTTQLCGHTYHTVCSMLRSYEDRANECAHEGCYLDSWRIMREISNKRSRRNSITQDHLIEGLKTRDDFKGDLKIMKKSISGIRLLYSKMLKEQRIKRNEMIHRHIHEIRDIQQDINNTMKACRQTETYKEIQRYISKYRTIAGRIFRKYHVSFRELRKAKLIRSSWSMSRILERHFSVLTNSWRFGVRLYPGGKPMKDPII